MVRSAPKDGRFVKATVIPPVTRDESSCRSRPVNWAWLGTATTRVARAIFLSRSSPIPAGSTPSQFITPRRSLTVISSSPSKRGWPLAAERKPNSARSDPPGNCPESCERVTSPLTSSAFSTASRMTPLRYVMASAEKISEALTFVGRANAAAGMGASDFDFSAWDFSAVPCALAGAFSITAGRLIHWSRSIRLAARCTATLGVLPRSTAISPVAWVVPRRKLSSLISPPAADAVMAPSTANA